MALFPSYDFMRGVAARLPDGLWEVIVQEPKMSESARLALLESLKEPQPPKLIFAVQGGLFAEGVRLSRRNPLGGDYRQSGPPQVSFERELMRQYYEEHYGKGFEFAYLYPGMNRVIQSVGRLIRSESDLGVAVLVCQRFALPQYSTLFPPDWSDSMADKRAGLQFSDGTGDFWGGTWETSPVNRALQCRLAYCTVWTPQV